MGHYMGVWQVYCNYDDEGPDDDAEDDDGRF